MDVRLFGIVREIAGSSIASMACEGMTVAELKTWLAEMYPRTAQLSSLMIAVNGEYAGAESIINKGDEVAVIPPVSGG